MMLCCGRKSACLSLIALAFLAGCNSKRPEATTFPVKGEVTYDGQPLADGNIQFVNVGESFNRGFPIKDGKFEGQSIEGEMRVEITALKEGKIPAMYKDDPNAEVPMENYLPEKYNRESTLTADVKADGDNTFTFKLDK